MESGSALYDGTNWAARNTPTVQKVILLVADVSAAGACVPTEAGRTSAWARLAGIGHGAAVVATGAVSHAGIHHQKVWRITPLTLTPCISCACFALRTAWKAGSAVVEIPTGACCKAPSVEEYKLGAARSTVGSVVATREARGVAHIAIILVSSYIVSQVFVRRTTSLV